MYLCDYLFIHSLSCGYGEKDENKFYDSVYYIDPDYSSFINPKKSFLHISKDFGYIPILQLQDNEKSGVWESQTEYGYLYTEKSDLSFLIFSGFYHGDSYNDEYPSSLKVFKKFNKKKISELSTFVINHIKKNDELHSSNIVNLNKNIKWDYKLLNKIFTAPIIKKKF